MTAHDTGAERIVLGSMMNDPTVVPAVAERLSAGDFYDPRHGTVFAAILKCHESGEPTEPVAVTHKLLDSGDLQRIGGAPALHDLCAAVPVPSSPPGYYVSLVAEHARCRRAGEVAARLLQASESGRADRVVAALAALEDLEGPDTRMAGPWSPVDLEPYLTGQVTPSVPSIGLARSDGLRLLYAGKEHAIVSEMEAGKSWFCVGSAAAELLVGNRVVYIHFEEADPADTVGRLLDLDVPSLFIRERFLFVAPDGPVRGPYLARLLRCSPSLVVLDGVNEAMALHGWGIREEDGAAAFRRELVAPCVRAGAATLAADHVVKDVERRGRNAIGSVHKGNGLSGALIMLENREPFGRSACGRSSVYVSKDRPGHLRQHGRPSNPPGKTYLGELIVDDSRSRSPMLELSFRPPSEATIHRDPRGGDNGGRPASHVHLDEQVVRIVRDLNAKGRDATVREVRVKAGVSNQKTGDALTRAVLDGRLVERSGPRNSRIFVPT